MGLMICCWANSGDDGIHWMYDDEPPEHGETLFAVMESYITRGETMEILKYVPREGPRALHITPMLDAERKAHAPDSR